MGCNVPNIGFLRIMRILFYIILVMAAFKESVASNVILEGFVDALLSDDKVFFIGRTYDLDVGMVRYSEEGTTDSIPYRSIEDMTKFDERFHNDPLFIQESFCTETTFSVILFSRPSLFFGDGQPFILGMGTKWFVVAEPAQERDGTIKKKFRERLKGIDDHIKIVPKSLYFQDENAGENLFFLLKWIPMDGLENGPRGDYPLLSEIELEDVRRIVRSFCEWRSRGIDSLDASEIMGLLPKLETEVGRNIVSSAAEKLILRRSQIKQR